ncbi:Ribosomal RNA small subunit methyltransferase G [Streptomyces tanashiensis]
MSALIVSHHSHARRAVRKDGSRDGGSELPEAPEQARTVFGEYFPEAVRYAELLADAGVKRGLIGPREVPRLWERHLLNCAVLSEVVPRSPSATSARIAGLPGIPLALVRPDLKITLLEPLLRRTNFLQEVVELLGLDHVTVVRGRAEEMLGKITPVHVVTARAVAPLDRLAGWGVPLLRPYGEMLALKGDTAQEEIDGAVPRSPGSVWWRPRCFRWARASSIRCRLSSVWRSARAPVVCGSRPSGPRPPVRARPDDAAERRIRTISECRTVPAEPQGHGVSRETSLTAAGDHQPRPRGCHAPGPWTPCEATRAGYGVVHRGGFTHRTTGLAGSRPRKHGRLCSSRA